MRVLLLNAGSSSLKATLVEAGRGWVLAHGIFRPFIENGWQQERPDNWLRLEDPWEVARPHEQVEISRNEPGVFRALRDTLLTQGDHYMHLADLRAYLEADQRLLSLHADPQEWAGKAILNVAASGRFSSDRTIRDYPTGIWNAGPCPVT